MKIGKKRKKKLDLHHQTGQRNGEENVEKLLNQLLIIEYTAVELKVSNFICSPLFFINS